MAPNRFDTLTRFLTTVRSRRGILSGLLVGTLGLLASSDAEDVVAKNCKKIKDKKKRKKCLAKAKDNTNQTPDTPPPDGGATSPPPPPPPPPVRQVVARTFSNTGAIVMNNGVTTPYPSTIVVSGLTNGVIKDVNLILRNFSHTWPEDVDILLTATHLSGNALVMADAGGDTAATNLTLTLDDQATNQLPFNAALVNGATYRPANHADEDGSTDIFPSPAPTPTGTSLTAFNGQNPNGTWQLFVRDDFAANQNGSIAGGWTLDMLVEVDV